MLLYLEVHSRLEQDPQFAAMELRVYVVLPKEQDCVHVSVAYAYMSYDTYPSVCGNGTEG